MQLATLMVFGFGALIATLIVWPIGKHYGRKEMKKEYKNLENAAKVAHP